MQTVSQVRPRTLGTRPSQKLQIHDLKKLFPILLDVDSTIEEVKKVLKSAKCCL